MERKLVFELCRSAELSPDASIIAAETLTLPSVALIAFVGNALRKTILLMQGVTLPCLQCQSTQGYQRTHKSCSARWLLV